MELHDIKIALIAKGYSKSAEKIEDLHHSKTFIEDLSFIMEECISTKNLADDTYILFNQLAAVKDYREEYKARLIHDLSQVLTDVINPIDEVVGIYIDEDELKEVVAFYTNAVIGDLDAQVDLAHFYRSIEHEDWAFAWFRVAAETGDADALYWLGNYYFVGSVVEQNLKKTYNCYKQAAEKGHADAMNNYADMYLRGEYVAKDEEKALELFMKAAELGVPEAMYTLGYMYQNGVGTEIDLAESREWFVKSAKSGDVFAANRLGHEAVEEGNGEEALSWYQMAAERGDSYGEFNLGLCYENGIGTPVNLKKAKSWYQKAALKGDKEAKERLKGL